MLNAQDYLKDTHKTQGSQFAIGTISQGYSSGRPSVTFDGDDASTVKQYPYLSGYTPVSGDRVLMALVSGSYVILGRLV
jgi:hypothetical protein